MKKQINTALIGCGRIGFLLENDPLRYKPCTHFGGACASGLKINYACDINTERLNSFAKISGLSKDNLYTDYNILLNKIKPEFVIISTWTESHAEIGIKASKCGARVIVCEKPIASNLEQADEMLKVCKKNKTSLIINHERRYDPRYRAVKRLLEKNKIGTIKTVHASILTSGYSGNSELKEGGGPLLHDGTHMIDIIRFLFGDIKSVQGETSREKRKNGFEDRATAWLKTKTGIDIFLEAGGNRKYFVFEIQISGTEGKIIIGNGYQHYYKNEKSKFYTGFKDLSERPFPKIDGINYFKREYIEAKKSLNNFDSPVTSSGHDGYRALEAIHSIYLSSYKKKRIDLPVKPGEIDLSQIFNL